MRGGASRFPFYELFSESFKIITVKIKRSILAIRQYIKHILLRFSLGRIISLGVRSHIPQRQLIAVYVGYAVIGTLLLMLPCSTRTDIPPVDNLFTVVSAVSTTGLATVDVATDYTFTGQAVILWLIQMGGLGYMTLSSFVMLHLTGHAVRRDKKLLNAQFTHPDTIDSRSMVRSVVKYTFILEAVGFLLLYPYFLWMGAEKPLWSAVFHSISAFCTAGFSIYSDNLMQFQTDWYVNIVIMALSVAGAMGFIMMTDLMRKITRRRYKISFTTKIIITITGLQSLWGTLHLFFFEDSFRGFDTADRLLVSMFQSVSAMTTVGYNTVDVGAMVPISLLVLSFLMYIGASPSGTGGGLKSTTVSAIFAYTKNKLGLHRSVALCGNIIPQYRVETAITSSFVYTTVLCVGIYLIALFEPDDADMLKITFESASALATAGLSSGILPSITIASKVVLILLMFIGRVGVITFGNAILIREKVSGESVENDVAV